MASRAKRAALAVTPPVIADAARRVRRSRRSPVLPAWEVEPEGWAAADSVPGWDVDGVVAAARARLPEFRAALTGPCVLAMGTEAAYRVTTASVGAQQEALVRAYALLGASRTRDHVSVLDWGGGLGFSGLLARAILPDAVALDYHCREQPKLVAAGREVVPEVQFWDDDGCFDRTFDLVVASSSLQYAEDWQPLLARFSAIATGSVLLTRVPVVEHHPAFVTRQRVAQYGTEYLGWVFNRGDLLNAAADVGLVLDREFVLGYRPHVVGAPEQDETRAYLFGASAVAGTGTATGSSAG